ncbi:MAG: hypothetical protein DMG59_06250, partial [Acidobacteria bacterium]
MELGRWLTARRAVSELLRCNYRHTDYGGDQQLHGAGIQQRGLYNQIALDHDQRSGSDWYCSDHHNIVACLGHGWHGLLADAHGHRHN